MPTESKLNYIKHITKKNNIIVRLSRQDSKSKSYSLLKQDAREAMRVVFFLYSQNVFVCTKRNFL